MATDFFKRQDQARRQTGRFVVYFLLGLLALVSLVYLLAAVVFLGGPKSLEDPQRLWDPSLFATTVGGVLVVVTFGCLQKAAQLSSGGKAVALLVNGREVLGNTTDLRERRLLNVVEEMAIASGVPVPPVYVLPEEGINAFAAGHSPGDSVVAVSQGCLKYLTRDELQGVVAHEFSHMLNGDVLLNLRIVALIFGITALSQIGWVMLQMTPYRSSDKEDKGGGIRLLGLGLYLLGLGGAFFGWLIQAAVSRQREFLADASAVQFTRNPEGIGGALKKIGGLQAGSLVTNANAGEISHMFLADAFSGRRVTDLFATHPPLEERILRLDPNFDGTFPEVKPIAVVPEETAPRPQARFPQVLPGGLKGPMAHIPVLPILASADSATSSVGNTQPYHVTYAADLQTEVPEILRNATQDAFSARALTYGLLLDTRQPIRDAQLAQLKTGADLRDVEATLKLADAVRALPDKARLPLLEQAIPALRQMSPRQYQTFAAQVDALINADQSVSLFEYALHCVLMGYLDSAFNPSRPQERYRSPREAAPQVAAVLSLLAWDGSEEAPAQAAFAAGMREYVGNEDPAVRLTPREQCSLDGFDAALKTLKLASPDIKRRVVASCAKCILADSAVTVRESELLRAICATLGCPMPPLVGDA